MKILFVAPRYHTNQSLIVKGLLENEHKVKFLVQRKSNIENYSSIIPDLMIPSIITKLIFSLFGNKNSNTFETTSIKYFIPNVICTYDYIKKYNPDLVIYRDRIFASLIVYWICLILGINSNLMYNQSPYHRKKNRKGLKFIFKRILYLFFPKTTITSVLYSNPLEYFLNPENFETQKNTFFVPFIFEVEASNLNRKYFKDNRINILDVGKYRDYKNHFLLEK